METSNKRRKSIRRAKVSSKEPLTEPENCIICLEKVSCRGKLSVCEHWFCFPCILEWSKNTNTCPVCKKKFRCISKTHLSSRKSPVQKVRVPDVDQRVWYDDDDEIQTDQLSSTSDSVGNTSSFEYDDDDDDDTYWSDTLESSAMDITSDTEDCPCEESYAMSNGYEFDSSFYDTDSDSSYSSDFSSEDSTTSFSICTLLPTSSTTTDLSPGTTRHRITISDDSEDIHNQVRGRPRSTIQKTRFYLRSSIRKATNQEFEQATKRRGSSSTSLQNKGKQDEGPSRASSSRRKTTHSSSTQTSSGGQWLNAANGRSGSTQTKTKPVRRNQRKRQETRETGHPSGTEPAREAQCSSSTQQSRSNRVDQVVISPDVRNHSRIVLPKRRRHRTLVGTFDSDSEISEEQSLPSKTQKRKKESLQSPEQPLATSKLARPKRSREVLREKQNTE